MSPEARIRHGPPPTLPAGVQRFGKYFLVGRIGAGGMAEVFRAVAAGPEGFHRVLVVKRILPLLSQDPSFVRMFVEEAKITALLSHPSIVQVHEFGLEEGSYFLAMEHVHGRDLQTILKLLGGRLLAPSIAADVARQVGLGLDYAHRLTGAGGRAMGIVHRDVSPANVMIGFNGAVKLLDFGLARAALEVRAVAEEGVVKGKLSYVAPEQLRGAPVDHRADVFGLGVVLHEALTGRRLFLGQNDLETARRVLELPIPPPSSVNGSVSQRLDHIVARALERDPARRYQTAGQMAADLEEGLLEARHSSQTLPRLMRTLFGEEAAAPQEGGIAPELAAALARVVAMPAPAVLAPLVPSSATPLQPKRPTREPSRVATPISRREPLDSPERAVFGDGNDMHSASRDARIASRSNRGTLAVVVLGIVVGAAVAAYMVMTRPADPLEAAQATPAAALPVMAPRVDPLENPVQAATAPAPPDRAPGTPGGATRTSRSEGGHSTGRAEGARDEGLAAAASRPSSTPGAAPAPGGSSAAPASPAPAEAAGSTTALAAQPPAGGAPAPPAAPAAAGTPPAAARAPATADEFELPLDEKHEKAGSEKKQAPTSGKPDPGAAPKTSSATGEDPFSK